MSIHNLERIFKPASVAVLGASETTGKHRNIRHEKCGGWGLQGKNLPGESQT